MTATIFGIFSSALSFVDFALMIVFLVIALTSVRTKRPDAFLPIALAAGLFLVNIVLRIGVSLAMNMFLSRTGGDIYSGLAASSLLGFIVNLIAWIMLLIGILRLASDPGGERPLHLPPGAY
ncbi:MAG: hypothetical protein ABI551_09630 [Polyangiaceae bacterium]